MDAILGPGAWERLQNARVLLVGAGGIGCELLKDLILMDVGEIHVLDLDTIDLSNLNRQFLFRQRDIKKSKALTAVEAVAHFNVRSRLVAHHGNVMDVKTFPLSFFAQFDVVYNALDNLEARLYVNRMALFTRVPLYESGTTGNKGQVQPIYAYVSECFHCMPKETPKTFPVCTIRSTPTKPVHAITWGKNFLLGQLFGERDQDTINVGDFTNEAEAAAKMREANELNGLKEAIFVGSDTEIVWTVVDKIYREDIKRLQEIEALWTSRAKPSVLSATEEYIDPNEGGDSLRKAKFNAQEVLSISDQLRMFAKATLRLGDRVRRGEVIEFDKDDEDTLEFVVSASNLRSHLFGIPLKSTFDVKQIAGNIIPAVATTNAIMAGFSALMSLRYFEGEDNAARCAASRMIYDSSSTDRAVNSTRLGAANPACKSCSVTRGVVRIDLDRATMGDLREALVEKYAYADDVEIMSALDSRLLYDYDMEENLRKRVGEMVREGDVLQIGDSEETLDLVELYVESGVGGGDELVVLPQMVIPPKKKAPEEEQQEEEEEDDDSELVVENVGIEEEGVILLEGEKRAAAVDADTAEPSAKRVKML